MSNITEYPVFEADQVLKADHLNNMFNYLDDQNRLTRRYLIGIGIVCGLDSFYGNNSITITKGLGVTSLGYLIQFDGGSYTNSRTYKLPDDTQVDERNFYGAFNMWKLFTPTVENPLVAGDESLSDKDFLQDKVVILFLEWRIVDLKNCTTNDCDDKGSEAEFTVQPLLISQKDLATFKYAGFETGKASLPDIVLKRYNVPFMQLKSPTDILNAFYAVTDAGTLKNIADAYNNVYSVFKPILTGEINDPFTNLLTTLTTQLGVVKTTKAIFTEYFYDYIDDLVKAYFEFREKADSLLVECCPDGNLFPFHLALCEALNDSRTNASAFRNYFIHSPVFGEQKSLAAEVRMLFTKMKLLVSQLVLPDIKTLRDPLIKITPSELGKYYLSQRAIPFYYNPAILLNFWSYEKSAKGKASKNLSYHSNTYSSDDTVVNPLKYELEPYNFFRVEGHIGKQLDAALANIVKQKQTFSLPFDVIALNVAAGGNLNAASMAKCHFADLESLYNVLLAELLCKIHEPVCFLSKLPYIDLQRFSTGLFTKMDATNVNAGLGATDANKDFAYNAERFSTSAGFGSVGAMQDFLRSSTAKTTTFTKNISSFYQYNQNFIDAAKNMHPYQKGAVLKHFCDPGTATTTTKTVGQVYLETIQNNSTAFPKPANLDLSAGLNISVLLNYVYSHMFYFIDSAEEMFATVLPRYLYNLDYPVFEYKYKLLVQEAEDFTRLLLMLLAFYESQNQDAETKLQDFIEDVVIDILIDEMEMITHLCMDDRIQQLVDEYLKRLRQLNLERMFSYYTMQHSGIDHKAGVPKGGTFILVYEARPNSYQWDRRTAITVQPQAFATEMIMKSDAPQAEVKMMDTVSNDSQFTDAVRAFELNKSKLSEAEFANALALIEKIRPIGTQILDTFNIGENIVFADFYLPYLCCSDCAPISYIIQDTPPPPDDPTIKLSRNIACSNDTDPITISVSPSGGTLSLDKATKLNDATYQVAVSDLPVGDTTITYTANAKIASDKVTVFSSPDGGFTNKEIDSKPGAVQFTSNATDTSLQHEWNFGDPNSSANNTSTLANPSHDYPVSDTATVFNVIHTVTAKEGCKTSVTQQVTVQNIQPTTLKLSNNVFCNNVDGAAVIITVDPTGGTISPASVQQINANTYQAFISDLPIGDTVITYTANGQVASGTVTVFAAPDASFKSNPDQVKPNVVQFTANDTDSSDAHVWNFGDPVSGTFNSSTLPNPLHVYNFSAPTSNFDVAHTVNAKNGCPSTVVNTITVVNVPKEIFETRVFCFDKTLPIEDVTKIKSAGLLNGDSLKPVFEKFGFTIDAQLQIQFAGSLQEVIQFTAKYTLDNGSSIVTKNVDITILGVDTRFNLQQNISKKAVQFTALAASPEKVQWAVSINGQTPLQNVSKVFAVPLDTFSKMEKLEIVLSITEISGSQACSNKKDVLLTRSQFDTIMKSTGGKEF